MSTLRQQLLSAPVAPLGNPALGQTGERRAVLHVDQRVWANPIEAQFGPARTFVTGVSDHSSQTMLARKLQAYLRWRNADARHPDVLAAQRRERAASVTNATTLESALPKPHDQTR